jgi:hypothetical protein
MPEAQELGQIASFPIILALIQQRTAMREHADKNPGCGSGTRARRVETLDTCRAAGNTFGRELRHDGRRRQARLSI